MSHDDHTDEDFSPEELAAAQQLASQVDGLVAGSPDRSPANLELLQVASIIHASHHHTPLAETTKSTLIEDVMAQAIPAVHRPEFGVINLSEARARRRRQWSVAATAVVATAAIVFLWLRPQGPSAQGPIATLSARQPLPLHQQSRSADALIGPISRQESGLTSTRLDRIYSDRMTGYRELRLSRKLGGH